MTQTSSSRALHRLLCGALHGGGHALFVAVCLSGAACGPRGASPIPQPPVLAVPLDHIRIDEPDPTALSSDPVYGQPGSAPAGALFRLTNLDQQDPPTISVVAADGSFVSGVKANAGDELRFEFELDGQRSVPTDAIFLTAGKGLNVMPSARFACISLAPGFVLPFAADGTRSLSVQNDCGAAVTLSNNRARLALPDFSLQTTLPLEIASAASSTLDIAFARSASGEREDVLFVDLALGAETIRYPVTLTAAP